MGRALATVLWLGVVGCGDGADAEPGPRQDTSLDGAPEPPDATTPADAAPGTGDGRQDAAARPRDGGDVDAASIDVSFARDVAPTFQGSCIPCHHDGSASGIDLTRPFDPSRGIVGRPSRHSGARAALIVDPGNADGSFLLHKLRATDLDPATEGSPMPWQVPRLDAGEIADVRQWIADGARRDDHFTERVAPIFGVAGALPDDGGGRCSYCHYPGTPTPPDLTRPFDPENGVIDVTGGSGVLVTPGDPDASVLIEKVEGTLGVQMPLWLPRPSPQAIEAIERWIRAGAPDN